MISFSSSIKPYINKEKIKFSEILHFRYLTKIAHTHSTFSDCCEELVQESEVNLDNYFDRIVIGHEI